MAFCPLLNSFLKNVALDLTIRRTLAVYAVPEKPYEINFRKMPKKYLNVRIAPDVGKALESVCKKIRNNEVPENIFITHKWDFKSVPEAFECVLRGEVIKGLVIIS